MEELSKRVARHKLLNVSEVEQNICGDEDHANILQAIRDLIDDKDINAASILKIIALYALKYG